MNWYKIAQQELHIEQEDRPDRTRIYLKDGDKEVGKLTIQEFAIDKKHYYITAFFIDAEYRKQGWGAKMMEIAKNLPRYQDKPIVLHPEPYGGEIGSSEYNQEIKNLKEMYQKMGFEDLTEEHGWMEYIRD